jgi:hypothetical protein
MQSLHERDEIPSHPAGDEKEDQEMRTRGRQVADVNKNLPSCDQRVFRIRMRRE